MRGRGTGRRAVRSLGVAGLAALAIALAAAEARPQGVLRGQPERGDPAYEAGRQLDRYLDAAVEHVLQESQGLVDHFRIRNAVPGLPEPSVIGAVGSDDFQHASAWVAPTTIKGLVLIRDQHVQDLRSRAEEWSGLRDELSRDQITARGRALATVAREVRDAYREMVQARTDADRSIPFAGSARDQREQLLQEAERRSRTGDDAGAEEYRQRARESRHGVYLVRARRYYELLDRVPELGIESDGEQLWEALTRERLTGYPGEEPFDYFGVMDAFLSDGARRAREQAREANGAWSLADLLIYGDPRFSGAQQRASLRGMETGSTLAAELVDAVVGVHAGWRALQAADDAAFGVLVGMGGVLLIPLGPIVCAGYAAFQIALDGTDLVITYLDEAEARELAKTEGNVKILDQSERVAAARGTLAFSVVTGVFDIATGARAVRVRGAPKPGAKCPEPAAGRPVTQDPDPAPAGGPGGQPAGPDVSVTPPDRCPAPGAATPPPSRPVTGVDVAEDIRAEVDAWRQQAIGRFAPDVLHREAAVRGVDRLAGIMENAIREALADGVPADRIRDVLRRVRENNDRLERALDDVIGRLLVDRAEAQGWTILVDPPDTPLLRELAGNRLPRGMVQRSDLSTIASLRSKAALEAAGRPQTWTRQELELLDELLRHPDSDLLRWYEFDTIRKIDGCEVGHGLERVFGQDDLDNLRGLARGGPAPDPAPPPPAPRAENPPAGRPETGRQGPDDTQVLPRRGPGDTQVLTPGDTEAGVRRPVTGGERPRGPNDTQILDLECPAPAEIPPPRPLLPLEEYRALVARQATGEALDLTNVPRPGIAGVAEDGTVLVWQGAGRWESARPDDLLDLFVPSGSRLPDGAEVVERGVSREVVREANLLSSRGAEGANPDIVNRAAERATTFDRIRVRAGDVEAPTSHVPFTIEERLDALRVEGVDVDRLERLMQDLSPRERLQLVEDGEAVGRALESGEIPRRADCPPKRPETGGGTPEEAPDAPAGAPAGDPPVEEPVPPAGPVARAIEEAARPRTGDGAPADEEEPGEPEVAPPDAAEPATPDAERPETGAAERPETGGGGGGTAVIVPGLDLIPVVPPITFTIVPEPADDGEDPRGEPDRPQTPGFDPREEPPPGLDPEDWDDLEGLPGLDPVSLNPPGMGAAGRDPTVQLVILAPSDDDVQDLKDLPGFAPLEDGATRPLDDRLVPGGGYLVVSPDGLVYLRSLGGLGAGAIEMTVAGALPVGLADLSLVAEPVELAEEAKERILDELRELARRNPITARIDAYCVEFLRRPPDAGAIFRLASGEIQERFAPLKDVLDAGRRLKEAGLLNPDSDPEEYFHAIRQWALWTAQEELDLGSFGDAFVEHAKKNFEQAGEPWTDQVESLLRDLVPGRWDDIRKVLEEADRLRERASGEGE